ncbi:MAG: response regulator transcription factor [Anaerolineae bacterium]|jgi:DNA-binding response OmpR family regulator|nr:response regulator transcription factor [Anaerolineae bacterium]
MITILAVAHNPITLHHIRLVLEREGFHILSATSGKLALALAKEYRPSLIILDIMLPDMSGFELCSQLRTMPLIDQAPILFVSTYQSAQYVARALNCGGDDYLRVPFIGRELYARVRALLRRAKKAVNGATTIHMDSGQQSVAVNGKPIDLTPTEFQLLKHLCTRPDQHHTAASLLEALWQYPSGSGDTALVRNHIRNLRCKIENDPKHPSIILSLHGRGYTIKAHVTFETAEDNASLQPSG